MRMSLALMTAFVVAACGGSATTTSVVATSVASTVDDQAATSTTTTRAPRQTTTSLAFRDEFAPVLQPRADFWDSQFVDPGAVIYHGGLFYMFYNGISSYPAQAGVGFATSTDGVVWVRESEEPLFTGESLDYASVSLFVSSGYVMDDGTWVLYFYTQGRDDVTRAGVIGRATAPAPRGPWTLSEDPVLDVGPEGAWDSFAVLHPSVVAVEDGLRMYFDGSRGDLNSERDRMIGMASSMDGVTWTKWNDDTTTDEPYARSDPVVRAGPTGEWDELRAYDPNVVAVGAGYQMVFMSFRPDMSRPVVNYQFGSARSRDGITWTKDTATNPILQSGPSGWQGIYLSSLVDVNGKLFLYFDVQRGIQGRTEIWVAAEESG